MREELDEALLLELAERLADGSAADAELGREGDLEQSRAGGDLAAEDPGAQAEQDVLSQDASLGRWEGGPDGHRRHLVDVPVGGLTPATTRP